jgi:hypothetical protein
MTDLSNQVSLNSSATHISSERGAKKKGPKPKPRRYVVAPSVESNLVVCRSSAMALIAGVFTLELKPTMPAIATTIIV